MGLLHSLIYATIMFFTTFFLGSIPLSLSRSISPLRSRQLSILGVGLLVGVALTIIIPEGIEAIYRNQSHPPPPIGLGLLSGFLLMFFIDQATSPEPIPNDSHRCSTSSSTPLVIHSEPNHHTITETDRSGVVVVDSSDGSCVKPLVPSCSHTHSSHQSLLSTTLGLLTHSLADGISLGASSTFDSLPATADASSTKDVLALDLIVFIAIIVHKAPVAFGLVAVLMSEGIPRHIIRRILFAFSLATPLGSLITWSLITTLIGLKHDPIKSLPTSPQASMQWWIGMTLLFSGGTFLFIAIHAMQHTLTEQVSHLHSKPPTQSTLTMSEGNRDEGPQIINHHQISSRSSSDVQMSRLTTSLLMVSGMITPSILTRIFGHAH